MMYADSFSYPKLETTNPQHMSYSSSSYTPTPLFIPQLKHFLLQRWLCNRQPHCCVICEAKSNYSDQTKAAQGRTIHLPGMYRRTGRNTGPSQKTTENKKNKSHTTTESFHNNDYITTNKNMPKCMPRSYGRSRCMWCTTQGQDSNSNFWPR